MTAFVTVPERADLLQIQKARPLALNKRLRNTGSAAGTDAQARHRAQGAAERARTGPEGELGGGWPPTEWGM